MWSIGCVTAVLLTGGSPFQHPDTLSYSRELAQECNIAKLEAAEEWIDVGHRARDFVRRLLTLDESQRMTAKEALLHDWFTNPFHERIFEQIYQHSIADWKPKSGKIDQIWDSHSLTGPEPNGQVYQCQSAGNRTSSTNASLQINHTVPSHKAGDGAHTGHMASAIVVDAKTHGFESLTIQGSKLPLLSGPVTARPQMRLPFSQAAWNEVIDSPKPLKVQHSMGPPSNAYPCRPMQTGGGQFQSIVKLSRPMSKVLQGIKQGGNKRCADI